MVSLATRHASPTLDYVDEEYAKRRNAEDRRRAYLGISGLGEECERRLWYDFRWVARAQFPAAVRKRFDDGHAGEDIVVERLAKTPGLQVHAKDERGEQFEVIELGGHVRGHLDGAILGILESPKVWHVLEVKISEQMDKLLDLASKLGQKNALREWNFKYYVQAILYMHLTGMSRHFTVVAMPGVRAWVSVRTNADPVEAARQLAKAERVVFSDHLPARISERPEFWKCRGCNHADLCHGKVHFPLDPRNCRTCLHSTVRSDGFWSCERHNKIITVDDQERGCNMHLLNPGLVNGKQVDAGQDWVEYRLAGAERWRDGYGSP
jgi:CRISPR/Cas system-associated exonuclease Cas4 (RecB family)